MNEERRTGRPMRGRVTRWLGASAAAALFACALPAVASATDYCVAPKTGCGVGDVGTLEEAIDLANDASNADRILLGAWTYTAANASGFDYSRPDGPVEIVGQGQGQTVLTGPTGAIGKVLWLVGGAGTSIHDLTIRLPQNVGPGYRGLATNGLAHHIDVVEDPTQNTYHRGVDLKDGGALEDSSVTLGGAQETIAVFFDLGGGAVRRSVLTAQVGVMSNGGTIERSRLTGTRGGVQAYRGVTTITGSLIRFSDGSSTAISADVQSGTNTTINADGVTIIGPGLYSTYGAYASNWLAGAQNAKVNLTNSIVRGVTNALDASAPAGATGQATVATSYSDYDPATNTTVGANADITEASVSNVGDAGFVDAAGGDFHLLPSSPLIDAGDPATPQGLDLDGNPLVADGNGDAGARRDMGAFELPATPDSGGGEPAADGSQQGDSAAQGGSGTEAGSGTQGAPPALDTQAPLIGGFRAAPSVFVIARAATPLAARLPRGTRFRYTLDERAKVTLTIQRALGGRRAGGRCMRPSPRLRQAQRCTRYSTVGSLSRSAQIGANSIKFTGRLGKRALRPGRYRALITAADTAGNRSAPRAVSFRIAGS